MPTTAQVQPVQMPASPTDEGPQTTLSDADMGELKEVIVEFLAKYEGLYEKRIQKLIFYSEIETAKKTGQRLTDASFMPYHYGPYSRVVTEALEQLAEDGRVNIRSNGQYATGLDGGELSPKKQYLIERLHEETKRMSTDELVDRAKDTWLWENFAHGEEMDFATYLDDVVVDPDLRETVGVAKRDPADNQDLEDLLS